MKATNTIENMGVFEFSTTRFSVINDARKAILGKDLQGIFKPGIVYEVFQFFGEIVIRPIGEYALPKTGQYSECSDLRSILYCGMHLITKKMHDQHIDELNSFPDGKPQQ
jgi:hypothetical protein